ncbi:MAG: sugar phosphate isomerase/epimerase family protein [Halobacteriota archaeon]
MELMCLYWTTAGVFPGTGETSRFDFKKRVEAVARAGFEGIGIHHADLEHVLQTRTMEEVKRILDDNGIKHVELELLTDWFLDGVKRAESDRCKRRLLNASEALQAKHIKVGDLSNIACPISRVTKAFAALCEEAQDYGATIGFELMASAMIDNLKDALTMIEAAGAENGGLILDIAQVVNLGITCREISQIPLQYLINVELSDGTLPRSSRRDMLTVHSLYGPSKPRSRKFCGEGEFDIRGFITCLRKIGYTGPWAVEVFSEELAGLSLEELSTRAYKTTIAQFEAL